MSDKSKARAWQFIPVLDEAVDNVPPSICTVQRDSGQLENGTSLPAVTLMRKVNAAQQYVIPADSPMFEKECAAMERIAPSYRLQELDLAKGDKIGEIPERMRPKKPEDPAVAQLRQTLAEVEEEKSTNEQKLEEALAVQAELKKQIEALKKSK